ncbi:hypothetical protein AAFF_G00277050 [Aldrovandia affinis]|uniref:Uncharacterized protein n=1 Tax=Aldrovandia affinis TaxID=143900 RepID=A0AAD7RAV0_9TELE|nr:hypothetical protein AAFF_G00277050 [Aldrovandia affinis]
MLVYLDYGVNPSEPRTAGRGRVPHLPQRCSVNTWVGLQRRGAVGWAAWRQNQSATPARNQRQPHSQSAEERRSSVSTNLAKGNCFSVYTEEACDRKLDRTLRSSDRSGPS